MTIIFVFLLKGIKYGSPFQG